jgi:hypothetical protein
MLRGAPTAPRYLKERAPSLVNQLGIGDLNYNSLNGSGWSFWTQTDWSGGFQRLKFKDDASFKDGQGVDVTTKYGEASLQYGWSSAARISGSYSFQLGHGVHESELLMGVAKTGNAKILKLTSANVVSTLSAYVGIDGVRTMDRFKNDTIIGLSRPSGTVKTMVKYNGSAISGFRSANEIVRSVKGIGIRLYSGERVKSLSGDVLYYSTDLTTFTSAYQAGKNRNITHVEDIAGSPFFLVREGAKVDMFRWDEFAERAYPIYTWSDLSNYGVEKYLSFMVITGTSSGKRVAYAFNGARLWQIFDDQLRDTSYNFQRPFEFEGNLHVKGAQWDGSYWFPGLYGKLDASRVYSPFVSFNSKPYGSVTSGTHIIVGYQNTSKYAISGHIISSEFGSNIAGVDKLLNSVDINTDALTTGQTVEILRSIDGGSTFSTIGKASYAQDGAVKKKTLYFPSGFVTKLWNYKAQLVGPGTSTPILRDVTFQYRPVPDLRRRWSLAIDAGDNIKLLNQQDEQRDGKALMQSLWLEMDAKRSVIYEDVDAFETSLVSAMSSGATSARVANTRLMPPQGRIRVTKNNQVEEMTYTSADGGTIKGIARGLKNTLSQAYTSADKVDNYYNVIVTDFKEQVNDTNQNTTESIAQVVLLEV